MGVVFDKLVFVKRLEGDGGFTRPQTETLSDALHQAITESVATKADVEAAKSELHQDIGDLRVEVGALRTEVKRDIAELRTELKHEMALLESRLKYQIETNVVGLRVEIDNVRTGARHNTEIQRAEMKAGFGEMRAAISEARVWAVGVAASGVAVLAAMKHFG